MSQCFIIRIINQSNSNDLILFFNEMILVQAPRCYSLNFLSIFKTTTPLGRGSTT